MLLDHEQRAVGRERDAVRHLQALRELDHFVGRAVALGVEHGDHAIAARAHVDASASLGDRQRASAGHAGEQLDGKPRRRVQPVERQLREGVSTASATPRTHTVNRRGKISRMGRGPETQGTNPVYTVGRRPVTRQASRAGPMGKPRCAPAR